MQRYRRVLGLRGVPSALLLIFLARIPLEATSITLVIHVVSRLGRGYAAAGLIGTALTVGTAVGGPVVGRLLDRFGLRPVVAACATASTAFWASTPYLSYWALVALALPAGVLLVPVGPLSRQIFAALVPSGLLRTVFSLDSSAMEIAYIVGPAGSLALATQVSTTVALTAVGVSFGVTGAMLWVRNPPLTSGDAVRSAERPRWREWVTPGLVRAYLVTGGALFVLVGMEVAMLAAVRAAGDVDWTSVVLAIIACASLTGGLIHGAARRSLSQLRLMVLLAVLTVPAGLFGHAWWLLAIALIPANLACAPTIAACSEAVTEQAPERVRGVAAGLQSSAMMAGLGLGSPVVGFVIDHASPAWGFVAAGGVGLAVAAAAWAFGRRSAPLEDAVRGTVRP